MNINASHKLSNCPLCSKDGQRSIVAENLLSLNDEHTDKKIFYCKSCDFYWLYPPLSNIEKSELYSGSYFEDTSRNYSYEAQVKDCENCFIETAEYFSRHLLKGSTILDVGCASGRFLEFCKQLGINGIGVEFSSAAAAIAEMKGIKVIRGDIYNKDLDGNCFDAIHMSHVLEHLDNPRSTIQRLRSIIKPDGLLYIEVPRQFDSWLDKLNILRGKKFEFGPFSLHHASFFSPKSMRTLLESEGFIIESLKTYRACKRKSRQGLLATALQIFIQLSAYFEKGDLICVFAKRTPTNHEPHK